MSDNTKPEEIQKSKYSYETLFIKTKTIEEIFNTAKVVIDTNILLSAYQTKPITLKAMLEILTELSSRGRLIIPSHVVWEFSRQRPKRIEGIVHELQQHINNLEKVSNIQPTKKLVEILPALDILEEAHKEILNLQQSFQDSITKVRKESNKYKDGLSKLTSELSNYFDRDPIVEKYEEIIKSSYFDPEEILEEVFLEKEGKRRLDNEIPPGFRDKTKGTNKYGDLIIWLQICKVQDDVIFITFDNKDDWVYRQGKEERNKNNRVMGARRELVEEFYEKSGGKTFKILHPADFIGRYKGESNEEVEEDLKSYESKMQSPSTFKSPIASGSITLYNPKTLDDLKEAIFSLEQEIEFELQNLEKFLSEEEYKSQITLYNIILENKKGEETWTRLKSHLVGLETFKKTLQEKLIK